MEKEIKANKIKSKDFLKLIAKSKPKYSYFAIGMLSGIVGAVLQLIVPQMIQPLISGFAQGINYGLLGNVVLVYILSALLGAIGASVLGFFGENVVKRLRLTVWNKMVHLPVKYFDEVKTGEIGSRLVNDTTQVKDLLANTVPQTLTSLLLLVGSIFMMFRMDWQMTVAMVIAVPIATLIIMPLQGFLAQQVKCLAKFVWSSLPMRRYKRHIQLKKTSISFIKSGFVKQFLMVPCNQL